MNIQLVAFSGLLLAACVPVHDVYYIPVGGGDVQKQGPCGVNTRRTLYVKISSEVSITLDALSTQTMNAGGTRDRTRLLVTLHIPQNHRVRLESDVLTIEVREDSSRFSAHISGISDVAMTNSEAERGAVAPLRELVGTKGVFGGTASATPSVFQFSVDLPVNEPRSFSVTLPDMTVDGVTSRIKPIEFALTSGSHWAGLCQ